MTKITSVLLLISITLACKQGANKQDCAKFKTGRFFYESKTTADKFIIERGDSLQKEINEVTGKISTMKISWLSDCEYELTQFYDETPGSNLIEQHPKGRILTTTILEASDSFYVFSAEAKGSDKILKDTIRVMR